MEGGADSGGNGGRIWCHLRVFCCCDLVVRKSKEVLGIVQGVFDRFPEMTTMFYGMTGLLVGGVLIILGGDDELHSES